jgi:hypothetical protein
MDRILNLWYVSSSSAANIILIEDGIAYTATYRVMRVPICQPLSA